MMDPPYTGPKMEAQQGSGGYVSGSPSEIEIEDEARVYGSRWVEVETEGGGTRWEEVSLTWEDLFDPQEGDHVSHGNEHSDTIYDLLGILRFFFEAQGREDVLIVDDMKMLWADPKISKISPDVAVIFNVKDPKARRDSFSESEEKTRPSFALEVTSRKTATFDRNSKPPIYGDARVEECLIVDRLKSPWKLTLYRLDDHGEQIKIPTDEQKGYLSEALGIHFSIGEDGKNLVLRDAATSEVLLPPQEGRRKEAEARVVAEQRAAQEAEARRKETQAREAAERKAADHEAKTQELLAEIERLKSSGVR